MHTGLVLALVRSSDVLITERRCLALGLLAPAPNPIRRVGGILTFPTEDKCLYIGPCGHAFTGADQDGIEVHASFLRLLTPALCPISGSGKGWLPGPTCRHRRSCCTSMNLNHSRPIISALTTHSQLPLSWRPRNLTPKEEYSSTSPTSECRITAAGVYADSISLASLHESIEPQRL